MRDPLKLDLEYLASTYGIDLGLAWIEFLPDGNRRLVLVPVPTEGVALLESFSNTGTVSDPLTERDLFSGVFH